MTVIAAFRLEGFPILFGDLLTTGTMKANDRTFAIPAVGHVQDFFGDSGWAITGLHQKVTLITSNCVVAWAGSYLGARIAISALKSLSQKSRPTCEMILHCLGSNQDIQQHPASFVGFVLEDDGIRQFQFQADQFESASLGIVYLCGTGSYAIHEFSDLLKNAKFKETGATNIAVNAVAHTLMLGGLLLQSEFRGGDSATTLMNMFGGGYEIAFYQNGGFQKLSDLTYVFWEAKLQKDGVKIAIPEFVVKQKYIGDHLFIRSARTEASLQGAALRIKDEQRHVIRPMFESANDIEPSELASISLQSNLLCHCILVRNENSLVGVYTRVQRYAPSSKVTITIEDQDDQIIFGFQDALIRDIAESLQRFRSK